MGSRVSIYPGGLVITETSGVLTATFTRYEDAHHPHSNSAHPRHHSRSLTDDVPPQEDPTGSGAGHPD